MSETDVAIGAIAALQKQVAGLQTHNEVLYRDNVSLSEVADSLRAKLQAAEAERDGANRRADLFREKLTDCESALHEAEEKNQELIKNCAEWMSPEDYVPLSQKVDDLAALVRILVHSLRKVNPNSSNIIRAMDYLTRKGLTGSILRSDEPQPHEIPESGGHIESADCWCGPTVEEHPGGTLIIHNQTH